MRFNIGAPVREALRRRTRREKWLLALLVLVAAGAALYDLDLAGDRGEKETRLKILSEKADLHIRNVHYKEVSDSGTTWEIEADSARFIQSDNAAYFDRLRIKLTLQNGKAYEMTADKGTLRTDTRNAEIEGRVVVTSSGGYRFATDRLKYVDAESKVSTEGSVVLASPKVEIRGVGMTLLMKTEEVKLHSDVNALLK